MHRPETLFDSVLDSTKKKGSLSDYEKLNIKEVLKEAFVKISR